MPLRETSDESLVQMFFFKEYRKEHMNTHCEGGRRVFPTVGKKLHQKEFIRRWKVSINELSPSESQHLKWALLDNVHVQSV